MRAERIRVLLGSEDFQEVIAETRDSLTKKVMARSTSDEDRAGYLAEYHALDRLLRSMESEAQNARNENA